MNSRYPKSLDVSQTVRLRERTAGLRNLERIRGRVSDGLFPSLAQILQESPDPDGVVVMLDRFLEATPREMAGLGARQSTVLRHLCEVFAHSQWLGETVIRNPDLLHQMARDRELSRFRSREEFLEEFARFRLRSADSDLSLQLARFRKREYVRILLRDVLGIARLGEVTEEISSLADALIEEGLAWADAAMRSQYGPPVSTDRNGRYRSARHAVISLGKLGGNELNYSSDVDLMFLYDGGESGAKNRITNREYFIELAQRTTDLLSRTTTEGPVFRIDLRLRPQGRDGDLAVSIPSALQYYGEVAQDWELQAMIKARHSAGDAGLTRAFLKGIVPFVYRPNVNFAAIKTALQSRERIDRRARTTVRRHSSGTAIDVKLDRGGIRDIEFLVQCLQRVYGGKEKWLQSRGTLFALQKLHDKEHISAKDYHTLSKAYELLRVVEHHLQLRRGQQSHTLPEDAGELEILSRCMNRRAATQEMAEGLRSQIYDLMQDVWGLYQRVVYQQQEATSHGDGWAAAGASTRGIRISYGQARQRLAVDSPGLLARLDNAALTARGRSNLERFLDAVSTSPERYQSLLVAGKAMDLAMQLFEVSEYLSKLLVMHPEDLEVLGQFGPETLGEGGEIANSADAASLRRAYRRALLGVQAQALLHPSGIWPLLELNSEAADQTIRRALILASAPEGIAALALGRLGSREFDILSDADLLFVAEEAVDMAEAKRAVARVVEILASYTRDGTMFPVDMRLRPHGNEGELITTPSQLGHYLQSEGLSWEAVTYLRLRHVAGSADVAQRTLEHVHRGLQLIGERAEFASELCRMRTKLERSAPSDDLKTGVGGSYDIDFVSGYLKCRHGLFQGGTLAERVRAVRTAGLIEREDGLELERNAGFLRTLEHQIRLVTGHPGKTLPIGDQARAEVERQMIAYGETTDELAAEVVRRTTRNRSIYGKYLFD